MSEKKHSPAPWKVDYLGDVLDSNLDMVVPLQDLNRHGDLAESEANAHLIAAAPDLLAALETLVSEFGDKSIDHENVRRAFAAIKKARGE